jgi:ABC-type uncharacterized transport system substrate-binding protein
MVNLARFSLGGILILCAVLFPLRADAHPHVWVDYYVNVVANAEGITKLKFRWHFDDMFTSMVKEDFQVKKIDAKTVTLLRDKAFSNLKNYHYYIYTKVDGSEFDPEQISDFGAEMKGNNLEYTFTITLPHPAKKFELSLYDPEFYVDVGPPLQQPEAEQTGIMAAAKMVPKEFLSSSAEGGAKAPACSWKQGEPRVSATWGKFALFEVNCQAQ